MRQRPSRMFLAFLLLTAPASSAEPLDRRVEAVLQTPTYRHGSWGLLVVDAKSGEVVYEKNADSLFCPASVTKLFSTAAALSELGPDHRFATPVKRRGEVDAQGVLRGDLILVASGDLSLGGRTGADGSLQFTDTDHIYSAGNFNATLVPTDPLAGLDALARDVAASGIKAVEGDILVDDRLFEPAPSSGSGPTRVSPIVVNDNVIDVVATPGANAGDPATIALVPRSAFASVDASVTTAPEGTKPVLDVQAVGDRAIVVRGRLPVGMKPAVRYSEVRRPADFARSLFIEVLRRRGVRVDASELAENASGSLPSSDDMAKLPKVAEYTSPPFREYAKVILKVSHNLHASTLPMLLAARKGETTLEKGLVREGEALRKLGVNTDAISFGGGAGGARADLISPRATVALLRAMMGRPDFPAFEAGLPILGRDGTLAKAVAAESPARGHARAKTGTYWVESGLDGKAILTSKALAGYMETASGRPLAFAFFVNNVPLNVPAADSSDATAAAGRLLGKLCETFFDDKPDETKPAAR